MSNLKFRFTTRQFISLPFLFATLICQLLHVQNMGAQPDLTVSISTLKPAVANGETILIYVEKKNLGDQEAVKSPVNIWFSQDSLLSADDIKINYYANYRLEAGATYTSFSKYYIPFHNTLSATGYLIAQIDPEGIIAEIGENNNTDIIPLEVYVQQPPADCSFFIGPGDILCFQKTGDSVEFIAEQEDGTVQEYRIGLTGEIDTVGLPFVQTFDSIYIQNGSVVKKLADGTIAWQKAIPQEVYSHFTDLDSAAELPDGSMVFAGFFKEAANLPTESRSVLLLVKTTDDLMVNLVAEMDTTFYEFPYSSIQDTVLLLQYEQGSNLNLFYNRTSSNLSRTDLHIRSVDAGALTSISHLPIQGDNVHEITQTPCGSYRLKAHGSLGNFLGGLSWDAVFWIDKTSGYLLNRYSSNQFSDDIGSSQYLTTWQSYPSPAYLSSPYNGQANQPLDPMKYLLPNSGLPDGKIYMDFFPFLSIFRTGQNSSMIFGKTGDTLWVFYPDFCNNGYVLDEVDVQLCPGSEWEGTVFPQDTSFTRKVLVNNDFDTLRTINISILPSPNSYLDADICNGDFIVFENENLTTSGDYTAVYQNQYGCDSTIHLTLEVHPIDSISLTIDLCLGDPSPVSGITYADPMTYTEEVVFENQHGCDSVVTATLTIHPTSFLEVDTLVPFGSVYQGILLTQDTQFVTIGYDPFSCSQTLVENVSVGPNATNEIAHLEALDLFPNPFSEEIFVQFLLEKPMILDMEVIDVLGRQVARLAGQQHFTAGRHQLYFQTEDWSVGAAFLVIRGEEGVVFRKMLKMD